MENYKAIYNKGSLWLIFYAQKGKSLLPEASGRWSNHHKEQKVRFNYLQSKNNTRDISWCFPHQRPKPAKLGKFKPYTYFAGA